MRGLNRCDMPDIVISIRNGLPQVWCSEHVPQCVVINFDHVLPEEQHKAEMLLKYATCDMTLAYRGLESNHRD